VGFGLMCDPGRDGWLGVDCCGLLDPFGDDTALRVFVLFQLIDCATPTTLIAGAMAERMRFGVYLAISVLVSVFVCPVFGSWAWGGA